MDESANIPEVVGGLNYSLILNGNWQLELTLWLMSVLLTCRHHYLYLYKKTKDESFFKLTKVGQPVSYKCIFKFLFSTFRNVALHSFTVTNFAKITRLLETRVPFHKT